MNFAEMYPHLQAGKKVRCEIHNYPIYLRDGKLYLIWCDGDEIRHPTNYNPNNGFNWLPDELSSNNWEVVEDAPCEAVKALNEFRETVHKRAQENHKGFMQNNGYDEAKFSGRRDEDADIIQIIDDLICKKKSQTCR